MYLQMLSPVIFNIGVIVLNDPIGELGNEWVRSAGRCKAVWDDVQKGDGGL